MTDINRFSSRRQRLDHAFLNEKLKGAKSYKRIAGYFRSSIFELVGEEISAIPKVQIVCNSELDAADVAVSKHARETALKERWNEAPAEVEALLHRDRYRRLYDLLSSGRVEIRVVPKDRVFIHGKAGVITLANGSKTAFLGSVNESKSAWTLNYELLWEDPSPEAVQLRIPTLSDTCSNPVGQHSGVVGQLSERSDALEGVIKRCPTGVKCSRVFFWLFRSPSEGRRFGDPPET